MCFDVRACVNPANVVEIDDVGAMLIPGGPQQCRVLCGCEVKWRANSGCIEALKSLIEALSLKKEPVYILECLLNGSVVFMHRFRTAYARVHTIR